METSGCAPGLSYRPPQHPPRKKGPARSSPCKVPPCAPVLLREILEGRFWALQEAADFFDAGLREFLGQSLHIRDRELLLGPGSDEAPHLVALPGRRPDQSQAQIYEQLHGSMQCDGLQRHPKRLKVSCSTFFLRNRHHRQHFLLRGTAEEVLAPWVHPPVPIGFENFAVWRRALVRLPNKNPASVSAAAVRVWAPCRLRRERICSWRALLRASGTGRSTPAEVASSLRAAPSSFLDAASLVDTLPDKSDGFLNQGIWKDFSQKIVQKLRNSDSSFDNRMHSVSRTSTCLLSTMSSGAAHVTFLCQGHRQRVLGVSSSECHVLPQILS